MGNSKESILPQQCPTKCNNMLCTVKKNTFENNSVCSRDVANLQCMHIGEMMPIGAIQDTYIYHIIKPIIIPDRNPRSLQLP